MADATKRVVVVESGRPGYGRDLERRVVRLEKTKNGSARTVPLVQPVADVLGAALARELQPDDTDLLSGASRAETATAGPMSAARPYAGR